MVASAAVMGLAGLAALFLPAEILKNLQEPETAFQKICIQMMGTLYLGFALMNWMAKTVLIGGIYSRPLAMGNFFHFLTGTLTLFKAMMNQPGLKYVWAVLLLYAIFAGCFGIVAFTSPSKKL